MDNKFFNDLEQAEMVLVGIGEEFNGIRELRKVSGYTEKQEMLKSSEDAWLLPAWNRINFEEKTDEIFEVCKKLAEKLKDKNYFVVSVSTNDCIREVPWKDGRLVMPCGGSVQKQCINGCKGVLQDVTENDWVSMREFLHGNEALENILGKCPECGGRLVLNNVFASSYNEDGYLTQWQQYTKWLQGTLNKKVVILELGVGMQFPSVVRWPFEKVAFFNNKASFWRVNEKLYQLSEELKGKGTSISENAIDWLESL